MTFVFAGKNYTLTSEEYTLNTGGQCMSAIQGMDINVPNGELWIIGWSFKFGLIYSSSDEDFFQVMRS